MKFEQKIWAKTLLSSYAYLENICGSIDKKVISYGIGSASSRDAEFVARKILSLIERKKFLINTKLLVDKALYGIPTDYARAIILKYVDKIKVETAAKVMNVSLRTYFRKVDIGVDKFASQLISFGYDDKKINEIYSKENWIYEIYKSYSNKFDKDNKKLNTTSKMQSNEHGVADSYKSEFKEINSNLKSVPVFQC